MGFLFVIAAAFIGAVVGGTVGNAATSALGFFGGIAIGWAFARLRGVAARVDALQREVNLLKLVAAKRPAAAVEPAVVASPAPISTASIAPDVRASMPAQTTDIDLTRVADQIPAAPPPPRQPPSSIASPRVVSPATPGPVERAGDWLKRWFSEGNVPVKIGMLVLIAGVAALLKYATDEGWLHLPIEFRMVGIAIAAMAALAFGWRERQRRRSFGLALQGGAIGVLLLTVFAAFRVYHLLPPEAAFALMLILVAGVGVLAVLQDALALAVLGILAGFAAPILISTGSGNHVVLFSYYALLNVAIFAIAWVKPWRALNLLGFFSTFAIATAWGVLSYTPALFASTEPFLLLYFAIYLVIPILYAWRRDHEKRDIVDGSLVFGNPLIAFALQAALLDGARMPLAYSALALAAIYVLLAWRLIPRVRVVGESFAVLGVGFATLAVPLALSARVTACTFALEGAALVWLGLRQQRKLPQISGLALQALAACGFALSLTFVGSYPADLPIANGFCISALLIAGAAFISAWLYHRRGMRPALALLLYLWGLAWWIGAGVREIDHFVPYALHAQAVLGLTALTAALAGAAFTRTRAAALGHTIAGALVVSVPIMLWFGDAGARPFANWGLAASAMYAAGGFFALRALRSDTTMQTSTVAQLGWLWAWTVALAVALNQFCSDAQLGAGWHAAALLLPVLGAWAIALLRPSLLAAPLQERFTHHRRALLISQAVIGSVAFLMLLSHVGTSTPLTFIPILNPVELAQIGLLACVARWLVDPDAPMELAARRPVLLAAAGFAFVTAATLRATHQLGGVPWDDNLWSSNLAQTSLTVVWSVLGVIGWVQGSRRGNRMLWLAGAVLMGVVLAKLLLVDRTHLGNLFGIASFIAYGLLCTVIGYFAPAPPRAAAVGAAP